MITKERGTFVNRKIKYAAQLILLTITISPAQTIQQVATGNFPDFVVDGQGNIHLVYNNGGLKYKKYYAAAKTWSAEQNTGCACTTVERSDPDIVVDSKGNPNVYCGTEFVRWTGSYWQKIAPGTVRDTELGMDGNDNVYLIDRGGNNGGNIGIKKLAPSASNWTALSDPDNGQTGGHSDHVYPDIHIDSDNTIHVIQRHGSIQEVTYDYSTDGGQTWKREGVTGDRAEGPHITVDVGNNVFVTSGNGNVFRRAGNNSWTIEGSACFCHEREQPELSVDGHNNIYCSSFGGKYNIRTGGSWKGQKNLSKQSSASTIGFVETYGGSDFTYIAWEEGTGTADAGLMENANIYVAKLSSSGILTALEAANPVEVNGCMDPNYVEYNPDANVSDPSACKLLKSPNPAVSAILWGRFEKSYTNSKNYSDPYRDVTLNVTYTKPDNSTVQFWGFYDGGDTWKIRFMPDQTGTWKYSASFSDGTAAGAGEFTVVAGDIPGMIAKDETNPIWFGFKGGRHGLIRGFHMGDRFFAANWPAADRKAFLDWAQGQGYNLFSIASHYLNRDADGRGRGWDTPDLWDGNNRKLKAAEYREMEAILNDLADRKIMVFPFAGFFGQSSDFPTNHDDQELYIRYNLARIGPYWNVLYNVAGPEPIGRNHKFQNAMAESNINHLGDMIKNLDVFGHPVSIHNATGNDPFRNNDWVSYSTLQGGKSFNYSDVNDFFMTNFTGQKPMYAQECFWPGNQYHMQYPNDTQIRKKAYTILLSAAAINYADMDGNSSSGFSGSMDLNDKIQKRHDIMKSAWDFMESIPFFRMTPDQDKVNRGFCLAEEGVQYLVYLDNGGSVDVNVKSGEEYNVTWINPQNPAERTEKGTTIDGQNLSPPSGGDDWLVYVTNVDFDPYEVNVRPQKNSMRRSNMNIQALTSEDRLYIVVAAPSRHLNTAPVVTVHDAYGRLIKELKHSDLQNSIGQRKWKYEWDYSESRFRGLCVITVKHGKHILSGHNSIKTVFL
jgi:hypothetical protein